MRMILFQRAARLILAGLSAILINLRRILRCLASPPEASLWAALGVVLLASPAFADVPAEKRVALVIGNGAYESAPKLDNAVSTPRPSRTRSENWGLRSWTATTSISLK